MTICLPERDLPVLDSYDVLVVDCSLAGMAAAVRLASRGMSVAIVEPRTYPAREMTAKGRTWIDCGEVVGGVLPEPLATAFAASREDERDGVWPLHQDRFKLALEDCLRTAGVRLWYASLPVGVLQGADGAVAGIVVGNKSGRQAIRCGWVIDTSETALVARLHGAEFKPASGPSRVVRRIEFTGVEGLEGSVFEWNVPGTGTLELQAFPGNGGDGHVNIEYASVHAVGASDAVSATAQDLAARRVGVSLVESLKSDHPAFADAVWAGSSHEVEGAFTTRLAVRQASEPEAAVRIPATSVSEAATLDAACFLTGVPGVICLNDAARLPNDVARALRHPVAASRIGVAVADLVAERNSIPEPAGSTRAYIAGTGMAVKEQQVPQRGVEYATVRVPAVPLPELDAVDLVIVGGGTSGGIASVASGTSGLQTVLVDMNPGLGGTGTYGGIHAYWFGHRGGFSGQVTGMVDDMHVRTGHPAQRGDIPQWNIECKIHALHEGVMAAGVVPLLNAMFIGTVVEGNNVRGAAVATRYGPLCTLGRITIDCTGDGDVAAFAGAPYVLGAGRDHSMMYSYMAQVIRPGRPRNVKTRSVDITNVEDYTRGIMAERRSANAGDVDHGIYMAPRESRHIQADITLTLTDQLVRRAFEDVVAVMFSNNDIKGQSTSDWILMGLQSPHLEIEIPWSALLPVGLENIIVSGKAFSATHDALAAPRMQPDMENLGGVAALATALCIQRGETPRQLPVRLLQERLVDADVLSERILTRVLEPLRFSEEDCAAKWARFDPNVPLHTYSDQRNNRRYPGRIDIADLMCMGPEVVPFLAERYAGAKGAAKVLLAQVLAILGSDRGMETLVEACMVELAQDRLPIQEDAIVYKGIPPDQNAASSAAFLVYSLGHARDPRAIPVWRRVVDLLRHESPEDFMDKDRSMYYYVPAVCYGVERLGDPACVPLLEELAAHPALRDQLVADPNALGADYVEERLAYLEVLVARCLARCSSPQGYVRLIDYLQDARAIHTEHALTELVRITGEDFGKDPALWADWLERHGDDLEPVPWQDVSDPVQAWEETILVDPIHGQSEITLREPKAAVV